MTSVGDQQRSSGLTTAPPGAAEPVGTTNVRVPLATRRRRPGLIGLAVLVVIGGGLTGARLYQGAGAKTAVVVAARDVAAGHRLDRADLETISIAGPVKAIAADRLESLVGQTAAVPIVNGTVLNRAMLSDEPAADRNHAMVGLALKPGQLPADGLASGDTVQLVIVPPVNAAAAATSAPPRVIVNEARVYAIRADDTAAGTTVVTLVIGLADAPAVAAAGSAGQVVLIKVGG